MTRVERTHGPSRLGFLRTFLDAAGVGRAEAAEIVGFTQTGLQKWFRVDDAPLDTVMYLVEMLGYALDIRLVPPGSDPDEVPGGQPWPVGKRLAFVTGAMHMKGINQNELAALLGTNASNVSTFLKKDTFQISRAYRIAEVLGLDLHITIRPKESGRKEKTGRRAVSTVIIREEREC